MKKTISAGGVVLNPGGEVLVVSQHGRSWSLPKGHVDRGEDVLGAARREIHEETGVTDLELVRPLGHYVRPRIGKYGGDDPSELKTIHMFLFRTKEMKLAPLDPAHPEATWVPPERVSGMLTHAQDKEFFERVRPHLNV